MRPGAVLMSGYRAIRMKVEVFCSEGWIDRNGIMKIVMYCMGL